MPNGTSQGELDAFFDGSCPGGLTCPLQLEVKCSCGAVVAEWHRNLILKVFNVVGIKSLQKLFCGM
jgi:hypothetical protein